MTGLDDLQMRSMFPRVLMISTGHLTARTEKFLRDHDAADWPVLGGQFGDVGFMLWVDEGRYGMSPHLPADLWDVFDFAETQDAAIIIFQDTGVIIPELPTYGEIGAFEADEYLDRPRQSSIQLNAEAAEASIQTLSRDQQFEQTPANFVKEFKKAMGAIRAYEATASLAAMSYERLAHLRDLASGYRNFGDSRPAELVRFPSAICAIVEDIAEIIDAIPSDASGALGHNRRALEDIQFYLGST